MEYTGVAMVTMEHDCFKIVLLLFRLVGIMAPLLVSMHAVVCMDDINCHFPEYDGI